MKNRILDNISEKMNNNNEFNVFDFVTDKLTKSNLSSKEKDIYFDILCAFL